MTEILNDSLKEKILKLYNNPEYGLSNLQTFTTRLRQQGYPVTLKQVKDILKDNETIQQFKPINTQHRQYHKIVSYHYKDQFQMDLFEWHALHFKYLLTVIDVFSRYCWIKPLSSKDGKNVFNAFEEIMKESGLPKFVLSDLGKEFDNKYFNTYFKTNKIDYDRILAEDINKNKLAIVNALHRKLRSKLEKLKSVQGNISKDDIIKININFNKSIVRTIKMTPTDARKEVNEVKLNYFNSIDLINNEIDIKPGDTVRILVHGSIFDKKSKPKWSKDIYEVSKIIGNSIYVKYKNGVELEKAQRRYSVQKVNNPATEQVIIPPSVPKPKPVKEKAELRKGRMMHGIELGKSYRIKDKDYIVDSYDSKKNKFRVVDAGGNIYLMNKENIING